MNLWLVRHAPTAAPTGLCYGRLDLEADAQATAEAAQRLHAQLPPGLPLRCSPARRCRQLAEALHALRPGAAPQMDARLRELDFGSWEGRTWAEIGPAALDAWVTGFAHHAPGGGETVTSLLARVRAAIDEARGTGSDQAWITHAGVIRAARLVATGRHAIERASDWPDGPVPFGAAECVELR